MHHLVAGGFECIEIIPPQHPLTPPTGNYDWRRVVHDLQERYNSSATLDIGDTIPEYLDISREKWLAWWG